MSKIVQAANAMIANADRISRVTMGGPKGKEYFFLYGGKHKWSITQQEDGSISLWYYPGPEPLDTLVAISRSPSWEESVPLVHYSDREIGTKEAKATFSELHRIVKEKLYGIDQALDDIISSDG